MLEFLTYKVLLLVAPVSTKKISELHALCTDHPFLLENAQCFNL